MPRESRPARAVRLQRIIAGLHAVYPAAHCELNFSNPLELLIATILSAQSNDKQVNIVTAELFKKYRSAEDYATADLAELEEALRRLGLYRNKARNIQSCCRQLLERHEGAVPRTMAALVDLDGVGRKTANVVLGNAFQIEAGVVVDTHVARLSGRLGLTRETDPIKIEADLQRQVPQVQWTLFSHWLIWHGRRRCFARNPECDACEIGQDCPFPKRRPVGDRK